MSDKHRCVIVGGAPIENYKRIKSYLKEDDYLIFCDCGLRHAEPLGISLDRIDMIVGDFDSYEKPEVKSKETSLIELNPVKDDTDTVHAVTEALNKGFEDFLLLGMTGRRMDHSLANLYILVMLKDLKKSALIADDYSEFRFITEETIELDDSAAFFSLMNITGTAEGIDIRGAKYELTDAKLEQTNASLGVSNEVLPGKKARITVRKGSLLVITDITG